MRWLELISQSVFAATPHFQRDGCGGTYRQVEFLLPGIENREVPNHVPVLRDCNLHKLSFAHPN